MALHNGIDMVALLTDGFFSYTYGSTDTDNTMDLYLSEGMFENAPAPVAGMRRKAWLNYVIKTIFRR